ncbi:unnamed protein product [Polarella glacialis]|uniref:Uncharacterized protein n=1 Tax=Polarella glacialis TaxID=89957 RepID=A0A813F6Z1_POLGL|nr:unnamed protein product [Polarella glacialis]
MFVPARRQASLSPSGTAIKALKYLAQAYCLDELLQQVQDSVRELSGTQLNLDVPIQVTITLGTAAGIGLAFLMLRRVHPDLAELLFARGMTGIFVKLSIVFGVMSGLGLSAVILQSIVSIKAHLGLDDKLPGRTFEGVRAGFK